MMARQRQRAGDASTQVQTSGPVNIYNGVTEERARDIALETFRAAVEEYTLEARVVVDARVQEFGERLVSRFANQNLLESFADPSFQRVLRKAQLGAAVSDRDSDLDILISLLEERESASDRSRIRLANISRAVEIADEVDEQALSALTLLRLVVMPTVVKVSLVESLKELDQRFARCVPSEIPSGAEWLNHLEVLGAIRLSTGFGIRRFVDIWSHGHFLGVVARGGPAPDGVGWTRVAELVDGAALVAIIPHELLADKYRIAAQNMTHFDFMIEKAALDDSVAAAYKTAARERFGFGDVDPEAEAAFDELIGRHENLRTVRDWWNGYVGGQLSFEPTGVGLALAEANLRRLGINRQSRSVSTD